MMHHLPGTKHSIDTVFSVLLFGLFSLMILLLILFAAENYSVSVKNLEENQNLHTAMTYVSTKIRQHDNDNDIFPGTIEDVPALCLNDEINGTTYTTYIYLYNSELKELFTVPGASISIALGTSIAELKDFQINLSDNGFFALYMEDLHGSSGELLLHINPPDTRYNEEDLS